MTSVLIYPMVFGMRYLWKITSIWSWTQHLIRVPLTLWLRGGLWSQRCLGEKYNSIISLLSDPKQPTFLSLLSCFFYLWVPIPYLRNIKWNNTGKVLERLLGTKIDTNRYLLVGHSIHPASGFMMSPLIFSTLWNKFLCPVT